MDFSSAINTKMQDVESGSSEPFIVYRDNNGGWHCDHTQNQYGEKYDWVDDIQDPFAVIYTGKDFSNASFPSVYDTVLYDRIRSEYYYVRESGVDTDNLNALTSFFYDNVSSLSYEVTDYLTTLERPLTALAEMCPFDLTTNYEDWSYNEALAADAIDKITNTVHDRLHNSEKAAQETPHIEKINPYDNTHTISFIEILGYEIELGEDTNNELPYYVETNGRGDKDFNFRTDKYGEAIKAYSEQLLNAVYEMRLDREDKAVMFGVAHIVLTDAHCLPESRNADYTGKLVVVDTKQLLPEYRSSDSQLVQCTHGNGARPNAKGTSLFCKELYSGTSVVYGRHQILGIADENLLPQWAKYKLEIQNDKTIFKYGDYHFKPFRKFEKRDGDWNKQMNNASSDRSLGIASYEWGKTDYSHSKFYAASGDSECDIFKCIENGNLYIPAKNELFRYSEPPQKMKSPQDKKPSLLGKLDDAKAEAAEQNKERNDVPKTKKHGLEV